MAIDLTRSTSPFGLRTKVLRAIWSYGVWPMVSWLPRWGSPARIFVLRLFGARIGKACFLDRGIKVWLPWNLDLEGFVAIGRDVEIYNYGLIRIARMTVVSQYCYLCTGTHDYRHPHMPLIWGDVSIGSECWLAANCFVGPRVDIGDRSVVGAFSVVTKSLPSDGVFAGNPCQFIKPRTMRDTAVEAQPAG